jgi:2-polyprenyl-3-methyl-5-hydroxy-6-metoxy-1,4-benzoquinol methylase
LSANIVYAEFTDKQLNGGALEILESSSMGLAMSSGATANPSTLERLVPAELDPDDVTGAETYRLHIERYDFAASYVRGGTVLDCACGVGYGTQRLADAGAGTSRVTGVDIDGAAIAYGRANYGEGGAEFLCADATTFDSDPFDLIVSFETIEHVPDPEALIDNFRKLLKPGGILVASVPITPSVDVNPHHLHDFTASSFRRMFETRGFVELDSLLQWQPYQPLRILSGKEARLEDMRQNLAGYYVAHPMAALKRAYSTLVDGFCNKYLACAWRG